MIDNYNDLYFKNNINTHQKNIYKFLNSYLTMFFLIMSQFKPQSVINLPKYYSNAFFPLLNNLWIIMQILSFLLIGYMYILKFKTHNFNLVFYFTIYYISIISYLNGAPVDRILSLIMSPLSILMLIELSYRYGVFDKVISTIYVYYGGMIILNYISMLIFPNSFFTDNRGMNVSWIFGNYQQNFNWFVVFIAISCYIEKKIGSLAYCINIFIYLIIILTTVSVWSATTLSALAIIFGLMILYRIYPKINIILNPLYAYLASFTITMLIAVYEIQKYFAFIIEGVLKKNISFTGRMKLWNNALKHISNKPVFGNGMEITELTFEKIGKTTAHNHYINLLYNGGIVYLLLTCILVYIVIRNTRAYWNEKEIVIINISLIGYFVYFIAEAKINLDIFTLLLAVSFYLAKLLEGEYQNE